MSRTDPSWSVANRVGFVLVLLFAAFNLVPTEGPTSEAIPQAGPPQIILIADAIIAVIVIALVIIAWVRRTRVLVRLAVAGTVLMALSAFPAFFVPVPAEVKIAVAVASIVAFAACVLALLPSRTSAVPATQTATE